ncbi:hypothetical protein OUZ56_009911 [Daphnia magna]|nr:hypothetical protein OUZ56_009911 [Daphnia magna]
MGDDTITVTGGEQSIRGVENAKDGGLAKATETLSVKSLQEGDVYDSICPLKVNAIKWKIRGHCTHKSKITSYESGKGKPGTMMSYDFEDGSGKQIKVVVFNDAIRMLDQEVVVGKNYAISKELVQKRFCRNGFWLLQL